MQLHNIKIIYLLWSEGFWEAVVGCAEETVDALKMIIKFEIKNNGKYRIIETSLLYTLDSCVLQTLNTIIYLLWSLSEGFWESFIGCTEETVEAWTNSRLNTTVSNINENVNTLILGFLRPFKLLKNELLILQLDREP